MMQVPAVLRGHKKNEHYIIIFEFSGFMFPFEISVTFNSSIVII